MGDAGRWLASAVDAKARSRATLRQRLKTNRCPGNRATTEHLRNFGTSWFEILHVAEASEAHGNCVHPPIGVSSGRSMTSLRRTDLRGILDFLVDANELEFDLPYPPDIVARLGDLVASPGVVYRENDARNHRTPVLVTRAGAYKDDDDPLYWALGPDPIIRYRVATGNLEATRLSDVASRRAYRESALYREYFGEEVEFMIDLGLPESDGRLRSFLFCRRREDGDFSARDRAVLEALRPHFSRFEADAKRRRQLNVLLRGQEPIDDAIVMRLTARELEIVELVAAGLTNAEIATRLWVAPSTVKKHLENVYAKLGVGRRTAAASLVRRVH